MSAARPPEGTQPPPLAEGRGAAREAGNPGGGDPVSTEPFDPAPPQHGPRANPMVDRQRRKEELRTWAFLTFVMAPVLAVAIVVGYGLLVWIFQLFSGPPTYGG